MMAYKTLLALAMAKIATAHFGLEFPEWRADTLSEEGEAKYSQWTYPCAGVDYGTGNVTDWPLDGGAVKLALNHPWTYVFINLGLGENATNFNISLTPQFLNATGKGQFCVEKLELPEEVEDGTLASIQVVTNGERGSALYNCADIRFRKDAEGPSNCTSEMEYVSIKEQNGNGTEEDSSSSNSTGGGGDDNAAGVLGVNKVVLTSFAGLAAAFVMGLGL
ncbi:Fc.00g020080.m01.CDS01 [Cosmosporella sp. VM-42]